jgi:hypothetical protein
MVGMVAAAVMLVTPVIADASPRLCGLPLLPTCPVPAPIPVPVPTPVPTPILSATPIVDAGAQYDGRDGSHWLAVVEVAKDGQHLTAFLLGFDHGSCSNHDRYYSEFSKPIDHGATIDSAANASYSSGFQARATFITPQGKVVRGREEMAFTVHFAQGRLDGTLHDSFRSARLRCSSGRVTFSAYPAGSVAAPLHDRTTWTGSYTGTTSDGGAFSLRMFLPLRWAPEVRIGWTATCRNGYSFHNVSTLYDLPISRSRLRFRTAGLIPANRQGLYERFRIDLEVKFSGGPPIYSLKGTWQWSDVIYRAGHRLGACTTGLVSYYASGPSASQGVTPAATPRAGPTSPARA